jgi:son of sevenless-like protein
VHRLKKTWAVRNLIKKYNKNLFHVQGLPPQVMETFDQLKNLMTTEKNYLTYRNVVKLANPPCIPYLGVFLTDLVFIDEAPGIPLSPSRLTKLKFFS